MKDNPAATNDIDLPIPAADGQPAISVWGGFRDADLEARFRDAQRPYDVFLARSAAAIAAAFTLVSFPTDLRFHGGQPTFWLLAACRSLLIAGGIYAMIRLRRPIGVAGMNRLIWSGALAVVVFDLLVTSTRPSDYAGHGVVSVSTVLILYFLLPAPLLGRALPALAITVGNLVWLFWLQPPAISSTARAFAAAYAFNNAIGFFVSRQLGVWRRQQFAAFLKEQELRTGLEKALQEIKTLRGILPICAHCKRVRNDVGYWQQVEVYVRERTHAEFSHSICPDCVDKHFGKLLRKHSEVDNPDARDPENPPEGIPTGLS